MSSDPDGRTRFSVVIPAHDEAAVIGRCLAFSRDLRPGEAEIVVVANGCTDATADRARAFPGVRVVEQSEPSKTAALNAGDAVCTGYPRVYLDGDIVVSAAALRSLATRLSGPAPLIAAPRMEVALTDRPWAVRSFYRAFQSLPYAEKALVGLGVYAISATGRTRFGRFPEVVADDLFVSRHFAENERLVLGEHTFTVQAPRDLRSLVRVRTRVALGNARLSHGVGAGVKPEVDLSASTGNTVRALVTLCLQHPGSTRDALTYVLVTALARRGARRSPTGVWLTDTSTR